MLIQVFEWIVLILAIAMVLAGIIWMRRVFRAGGNITYATLSSNFFYFLSIVTVLVFNFSSLHLLWLFPLSFGVGFLTLLPQLSWLLVPMGKFYGTLSSLGLRRES